jgi:hypothetical protein
MKGKDMKFLSFLFYIVLISIFCSTIGCSNFICNNHHIKRPYAAASESVGLNCNVGYWEKNIKDNVWVVDYVAKHNRHIETLRYHNFYRCAELTLAQGFPYFVFLESRKVEGDSKKHTHTTYYFDYSKGRQHSITSTNYTYTDAYSLMVIEMYPKKPTGTSNCFNAANIVESYGKFIEREPLHMTVSSKDSYYPAETIMKNANECN